MVRNSHNLVVKNKTQVGYIALFDAKNLAEIKLSPRAKNRRVLVGTYLERLPN